MKTCKIQSYNTPQLGPAGCHTLLSVSRSWLFLKGSVHDNSSWGESFLRYCRPLDLGFALFLALLYYHLVSFECASSGASLIWVFLFSCIALSRAPT